MAAAGWVYICMLEEGRTHKYRVVSYIQQRRGGPKSTRPCFVFRSHHPWAWNSKKKVRRNGMDEGGDGHTANGYKFPCGMSPVQNRLAPVNGGTMSVIVSTYTEQLSRPHPPSRPLHEQVFFSFLPPVDVCMRVIYSFAVCRTVWRAHSISVWRFAFVQVKSIHPRDIRGLCCASQPNYLRSLIELSTRLLTCADCKYKSRITLNGERASERLLYRVRASQSS